MIRHSDAVRVALHEIEKLGYIVLPGRQHAVEVLWLREGPPPDVARFIDILQSDPGTFQQVLCSRTVPVPLWFLLGYPWDQPLKFWVYLSQQASGSALEAKKIAYAEACINFYKDKRNDSWKSIAWREPWPIYR